ncbi:MAG: A24 family peptidase [Oscillospiraceae bacterium]|jgi:prepilin signal peptidase PulO-like enzyme (type II secretory pathway)|nr:A24 family peptidase [Oscillospiraceae bacterium]
MNKKYLPYAPLPLIVIAFVLFKLNVFNVFALIRFSLLLIFAYVAALRDLRDKLIPNRLIIAMFACWVLVTVPQLFLNVEELLEPLKQALYGLLAGGGLFLAVYIISRKGLGGGDVKFMAAAGLYLTFERVMVMMFISCLLAGVFSLVLLVLKRVGRKDAIPLAPFLFLGILVTVFLSM